MTSAGLRALAAQLPPLARSNAYWRAHHPDVIEAHERAALAKVFSTTEPANASAHPFDAEMTPYLADPFRGTVLRRVIEGPAQGLEVAAARAVLTAARLRPDDLDLVIATSFLPDQPGVGNAAFLARALEVAVPAWNLESTCSSALVALATACAQIRAGEVSTVLVVVSCTYSRVADSRDSLSWFLGDGAAAFVVGEVPAGEGVLGTGTVSTIETCNTFNYRILDDHIRIGASPETGRVLRETAAGYLRTCVDRALARAGCALADIALFAVNTPTAWFAATCARVLDIDPGRVIDTYPLYANVGPALAPINLHHAAITNRVARGDLVLMFSIGSVGTASAVVMRWGEVALGPAVPAPRMEEP
jgi:3-oxoacyl-[acyl-carrier-protein] synthase-3